MGVLLLCGLLLYYRCTSKTEFGVAVVDASERIVEYGASYVVVELHSVVGCEVVVL